MSKRGWFESDGPGYDLEAEVFGVCGGAALYRRTVLDDVGLFDETFFANGEDVDLSFRARLRGYTCLYVPAAVVYHKSGASIGQTTRWFYWVRRNQLWVLMKNMPWQLIAKYAPEIVVYNVMSLIYHSLQGRGRLIWRAYFDALLDLPRIAKERGVIQSRRTASVWDIDRVLTKSSLIKRMSRPITKREITGQLYKLK